MANPKNRTSRKRRDERRASGWRLAQPALSSCPQCHEAKLPHRVCPKCGFYQGREVIKHAEEK